MLYVLWKIFDLFIKIEKYKKINKYEKIVIDNHDIILKNIVNQQKYKKEYTFVKKIKTIDEENRNIKK